MNKATRQNELANNGSRDELIELFSLLDHELRMIVKRRLAVESPGHVLQPAALVNEAFLRLVGSKNDFWNDRVHFLCIASEAMRRILIESARRENTLKRGGQAIRVPMCDSFAHSDPLDAELLDLNDALGTLESIAPENSQIVKLHVFSGLTIAECADLLGVSKSTAERRWRHSRAWLREHMNET